MGIALASLEFVIALVIILVAVLVYRRLINSPRFNRVVNEIVDPAAEGEDAIERLDAVRNDAGKALDDLRKDAAKRANTADQLRRRLK